MLLLKPLPLLALLLLILKSLSLRRYLKALQVFSALKKKLKKNLNQVIASQITIATSVAVRTTVALRIIVAMNATLITRASARTTVLSATKRALSALNATNHQSLVIVMNLATSLKIATIVIAMQSVITIISAMIAQTRSLKRKQQLQMMAIKRRLHVVHVITDNVVAIVKIVVVQMK